MALVKERDRMLVRRGSDCQALIQDVSRLDAIYKDISHLGTGRFSNVALVTHKESGQRVALKMFPKDEVKYVDFIREYNYSYFLSPHHNVVNTFDGLYATPQNYYFVQEFCLTASLREAVYQFGGIPEEAAKKVLTAIVAALSFMHQEGLVHRNLRAKNILIFDPPNFDRVKVTDMALTRKKGTHVKHIDDANEYHAPELVEVIVKETVSVESPVDVWAVGIIMYFALIGKYPWQKASPDCKPYFEWEQYMKKKNPNMPAKWGRFTDKGLKIFRKSLKPRDEDRCEIAQLKKYIVHDKWLKVEINKEQKMRAAGHRSRSPAEKK